MLSCYARRLIALLNRTHRVVVPARKQRPGKPQRTIRPHVEILEDRTVPSTVTWVGGTSGNWDTPSNWSTGAVPGATSDVVINTANATITHSQGYNETIHSLSLAAGDTLSWSGGKLTLAGGSTLDGAVDLSGGTWTVQGNLTLDGLLTWTAGNMTGSGTTTANGGIVFNNNGGETLDGRTLNNANSGTVTATSINLYLADGAVFNNEAGSNFNITSNSGYIQDSGATGTFKNEGTVTQSSATSSNDFDVIFQNTGTVNVNSGTLVVEEGGSTTSGGSFSVLSGAQLHFDGSVYNLGSSSMISGAGTVEFGYGTTNINGTYNVTGTTTVDNVGTVNFLGTLTDLGSTVNIGGGTAKIAKAVSIAALNLTDNGTLTGSGAVTVTSALNWDGTSTMIGTGSTTLASGATMNLGGDNHTQTLDGRTFYNHGTVNWLAGSSELNMNDGAVFNNELGATFNANTAHSTNQSFYGYSGPSGTFINAGTFNTAAGAGNTTEAFNVLFNNSGTVNINSGTLLLDSGGSDTKGTFFVPSGSTLQFGGGVAALASAIGSSTTKAAGTVAFSSGTTVLSGAVNDTGAFTIAASGGTVDIEKPVSTPYLSLTGNSTLYGSGALTVTATTGTALTWNGNSTMSGTGSITLNAHTTASLGGDNNNDIQTLDGRSFNNKGTVNWLAGSYELDLNDGAVFNNQTGATFNAYTPHGAVLNINGGSGPSGTFLNAGTFTNAPGAGSTTDVHNVVFSNSGKVNVNNGTLDLEGGGNDTSTGSFVVPTAATLQFNGGVTTLASSVGTATSPQAGAVVFNAGTTDVNGKYNVSGSTSVSGSAVANFTPSCTLTSLGGTVNLGSGTTDIEPNVSIATLNLTGGTLTGSGNVTVTSALTWKGGATMSGSGSTTLGAGATMSLGGDATSETLDARTFNNQGTTNWLANSTNFNLDDVAVFNNTGSFNANTPHGNSPATQYIGNAGGSMGTFNNAGTFNTAAGSGNTTEINGTLFNNSGTVNVTSGTLLLENAGGASTGSFAVSSGTTLQFDQGVYDLTSATTSVTGAGNVTVSNGETDFGGTYNITGATSISGGSTVVNFLGGGTTGTFTNSGGTVGLASGTTFTVNTGNYTQSGGATYLNGGTLAVSSGNEVNIEQNSSLYGPGSLIGNLANEGSIYVGGGQSMTGMLSVSGTFTQTSNGTLHMNIAGTSAGVQYDQLSVSGEATLGGSLDVSQVDSYNPLPNTPFTIITYASETGNFATINLPGGWTSTAGATSFTLTS